MKLITGATGHIGNVLTRKLCARGEKVRAFVLPNDNLTPLEGLDVDIVYGDVLDVEALRRAMRGVDTVFHLAGVISILPGSQPFMWRVNVEGTQNVLDAAAQESVRRVVYTSSIHALRRVPHGSVIDETIPFDPENPYGAYDRSKAEASIRVQKAAEQGKVDAVIVCPTGVIGPYDYRVSELGALVASAATRKPQLYVDGAYDFVDVRDVAEGILAASEKGETGAHYILSGQKMSVRYLLETIREITGRAFAAFRVPLVLAKAAALFTPLYYRLASVKPRFTPYSLEVLRSNAEISHARASRELGYHPRALYESLSDTIRWFLGRMELENNSL